VAIDNHSRVRQAKKLARKQGKRHSADRILIITEGSKTEPQYFTEIRTKLKLPTANINVLHSEYGTCPYHVVNYALELFTNGNIDKNVNPKAFEKVYAVFDRDDHARYFDALNLAQNINRRKLLNDQDQLIEFKAIASVPNFELWLLLHYEDQIAPIHRDEVIQKLKVHLNSYRKGNRGYYAISKINYPDAYARAVTINNNSNAFDGVEPFTEINLLMDKLINLKNE
jgi:hypothetical protein